MNELHLQHNKQTPADKIRRAFLMLAILLVVQIGAYGYLVNASVGKVVARMVFEKKTDTHSTEVARLEALYFTLQNRISSETAASLNYTNTLRVNYIDERGQPVVMLSRSN